MIYVFKKWDFWGGYWLLDTQENQDTVDETGNWFWMTLDSYNREVNSIPKDRNIVTFVED